MKKTLLAALTVFAGMIFLQSCQLAKDLSVVTLELDDIAFRIPIKGIDSQTGTRAEDNFYAFAGSYEGLNISDPAFGGELTDYIEKYKITFDVKDVKLTIVSTSGTVNSVMVKDLRSVTTGAGSDIVFQTDEGVVINLGVEFSNEALTQYLKDVFKALQDNKTLAISVSGMTNLDMTDLPDDVLAVVIEPTVTARMSLLDVLSGN